MQPEPRIKTVDNYKQFLGELYDALNDIIKRKNPRGPLLTVSPMKVVGARSIAASMLVRFALEHLHRKRPDVVVRIWRNATTWYITINVKKFQEMSKEEFVELLW
jgi:hypothetical protein